MVNVGFRSRLSVRRIRWVITPRVRAASAIKDLLYWVAMEAYILAIRFEESSKKKPNRQSLWIDYRNVDTNVVVTWVRRGCYAAVALSRGL